MSEDKALEAIDELRQLLKLSDEAAQRLKQDIPANEFPNAYKVNKAIRTIRKAVNQLRKHIEPDSTDYSIEITGHDMPVNNSDSFIGT